MLPCYWTSPEDAIAEGRIRARTLNPAGQFRDAESTQPQGLRMAVPVTHITWRGAQDHSSRSCSLVTFALGGGGS